MKKITLLALTLMSGYFTQAQVGFEASKNYGKLMDVTYDATVQNKLYAATQGNHIVVSTDNGENWTLLYSFAGPSMISDLKFVPGNNALSFGTFDAVHILNLATNTLTTSFTVPENGVEGAGPSYLSSYSLFDATGTVMLVDTGFPFGFSSQGKTFYTTNGGETWTEIYYTADHDNVFINNVAISPDKSDKLFLSRGNGDSDIDGGLWISNDAGATFVESLAGVTLDPISFNPSNPNDVLVGSSIGFGIHPENIFRSADGGLTWTAQPISFTDETLNNITKIAFNPANVQEIIALEENEILRTTNNGQTWTSTVYPVGIAMDYYYGINASFNPFNANQIAITTDFYPQHFNTQTSELTQIKAPFYNIISTAFGKYDSGSHLYYGAQGGRFHKDIATGITTDYNTESPNAFNPKQNYIFADPKVPGRVFTYASMGFFGGNLNMSTDYGATTTDILQGFADDMQELTVDPTNSNVIYVSLRSGEGGNLIKVDFTDLENIVSTTLVTPEVSEMGDGVVTGIIVKETNPNVIFIVKKTSFFKSVDGGETWLEPGNGFEGLNPDTDLIWDMQQNPLNPEQITVATNIGIFTTVDEGEEWTLVLPNVDVRRVKHSTINPDVLVGTVFANQFTQAMIVYSTDNGENWTTVSQEDLNYVNAYSMDYDFAGSTIHAYIGTSDLGVMKYEINEIPLATNNPVKASTNISIYPNPASAIVTINTTNIAFESAAVYSLTGQKVLESNSATLNVSGLSKGIYVIKVKTTSGKDFVQKLVKK